MYVSFWKLTKWASFYAVIPNSVSPNQSNFSCQKKKFVFLAMNSWCQCVQNGNFKLSVKLNVASHAHYFHEVQTQKPWNLSSCILPRRINLQLRISSASRVKLPFLQVIPLCSKMNMKHFWVCSNFGVQHKVKSFSLA